MARQYISTILGKAVKSAAQLRGGGSALPGLVVEKLDPGFLARTLGQLPHGVVIISGTNGKTTTTKIVVELLESAGLRVFTNRTGSNFSRGVVAALLGEVNLKGRVQADIAVLELDEAWAAKFVEQVKPRFSLLLKILFKKFNIYRD
jgi:UDP-N-acetylmuramoylalanine-D-glutamate ligase